MLLAVSSFGECLRRVLPPAYGCLIGRIENQPPEGFFGIRKICPKTFGAVSLVSYLSTKLSINRVFPTKTAIESSVLLVTVSNSTRVS